MPLVKKKVTKKKSKSNPKKLYAYVDVDGFIHWNILEGHAVWDKVNKEWMVRIPEHDKGVKE